MNLGLSKYLFIKVNINDIGINYFLLSVYLTEIPNFDNLLLVTLFYFLLH